MKDIYFINVTKTIAIFLVALAHLPMPDWLFNFVASFRIPLLFIVSGYLLKTKISFTQFVKRKIQTLIIPYFFFAIITFLFWFFFGSKYGNDMFSSIKAYKYIVGIFLAIPSKEFLGFNIPLWYLLSLFCSVIILYFILQMNKYLTVIAIVLCCIFGFILQYYNVNELPLGINISLFSVFFIYLGKIIRRNKIIEKIEKKPLLIKILFSIICLVLCFFISQKNGENGRVYFYLCHFNNYLLFFFSAITGSFAVILLSLCIPKIKLFNFLGRNTIIIMALHLMCFAIIKGAQIFIFKIPKEITDNLYWVNLIYVLLTFILLTPIIFLMNKYFPIFLGRRKEDKVKKGL